MYLVEISAQAIARLFANQAGPVQAAWFSGFIRAWRGDRRHTGYLPRTFFDAENVLEIAAGIVVR